jgi:eukaryotic-like serine/threonine-protein kinase
MKVLFTAALEVPASERAELLLREAQGDSALIAEVRSLLAAHDQPDDLLDRVPTGLKAQAFAVADDNGRVGERIGAYRIVGMLGTGGMGQVFKAVRDDDQYRAEVAIKLMRTEVNDPLAEQRFKTERQILAGLDHRNIARMLDGGTTRSGSPYVVMELVSGEPIDRFADAHGLKVRERVQLFLQVCAAVSYAHQHLIIHRDLKPSNILVTADSSVKLLDFGIAKLLDANAVDGATSDEMGGDVTVTQMRVMTLDYASPEQVSGDTVTTVSDVYSLGVVLYRLLTGQSPYGARTNDAQRVAEILSDTAPTRPSLVRTSDPQRQRGIDADLDNILLMALRKEPQRRYGSVEQFANDLRNYLGGLPVHARGNALRYRMGKFLRRRKIEIAAGVLVTCALLAALSVSLREARIADEQRRVAQQHFDSGRKLANRLLFELHDEIAKVPASIKARQMLVNTSLEYLDTLNKNTGSDRALQEELAVAYRKVADLQGSETSANTGDYQGALKSYARSAALLEPIVTRDPANQSAAVSLANTYVRHAQLMLVVSSAQEALLVAQKGVALAESLRPAAADLGIHAELLRSAYTAQADIFAALGRSAESMASLDKVIAIAEEYWRARPEDPDALTLLDRAYNNTAIHADTRLSEADATERSIDLLRKVIWADNKLLALQPDDLEYQRRLAVSTYNLSRLMFATTRYEEALELLRIAAPITAAIAKDRNDAQAQYFSALVHSVYARALARTGHVEEARVILLEGDKVLKAQADGGTLRIIYAYGQNAIFLGEVYARLGSDRHLNPAMQRDYWRQARDAFRQGIAPLQKVMAVVKIEPMDAAVLADGEAGLATAEAAVRKFENTG